MSAGSPRKHADLALRESGPEMSDSSGKALRSHLVCQRSSGPDGEGGRGVQAPDEAGISHLRSSLWTSTSVYWATSACSPKWPLGRPN